MSYFKDAKVDDKVYDLLHGAGKVFVICQLGLSVKFECGYVEEYTLSGYSVLLNDVNQRLFYYDNRPIVITQDDLAITEDYDRFRIDDLGHLEFIKDIKVGSASGITAFNLIKFKDYSEEKYTRKIRREEISPITQALYDRYNITELDEPLKMILMRIIQDIDNLREDIRRKH